MTEEIYMKVPPSLKPTNKNLVCKLNKSFYGLKQDIPQWNSKLTLTLTTLGYIQSKAGYSLFTKSLANNFIVILVHVDDILITGSDLQEINHIKHVLETTLNIKDLGNIKYFLGFEISRSNKGNFICQRKYSLDLLKTPGLLGAKPAFTPMDPNHCINNFSDNLLPNPTAFRSLIGK